MRRRARRPVRLALVGAKSLTKVSGTVGVERGIYVSYDSMYAVPFVQVTL